MKVPTTLRQVIALRVLRATAGLRPAIHLERRGAKPRGDTVGARQLPPTD